MNNKGWNQSSPPMKIGKTKKSYRKNSFGENLGGEKNKDTQTKLKN